jgi:hypothetical protein
MKTTLIIALFLSCFSLIGPKSKQMVQLSVAIPQQEDWVDHGKIIDSGTEGDWDLYLWGGFANSVVKKDGVFYLYYQGSNGYDDVEGTVTYRAIGVATSQDGIKFGKYQSNPVLTWFPHDHLEEGAVSAAASLSAQGEVVLYYGANTWLNESLVNADGRLAVSADGLNFRDAGKVLDHKDRSIWGSGDELFPIIGFSDKGRWFVYYIPNGVPQRGLLGVAWGDEKDQLKNSASVMSGGNSVPAWGQGGYAKIGQDSYVLFTSNLNAQSGSLIEARTLSLDKPNLLSEPVAKYHFKDVSIGTVYLDMEQMTWFMYYRSNDFNWYGVKTAPVVFKNAWDNMDEHVFLPTLKR